MMRRSGLLIVVLCLALGALNVAFAAGTAQAPANDKTGCASCPAGGCTGACLKAKAGEAPAAPQTSAACPKCGMVGQLCPQCTEQARAMLTQMAGDMCPNCEAPEICPDCQAAVEAALAKLPALAASPMHSEAMRVAYTAGKVSDGMEQLITNTVAEAGKQGLIGAQTYVGDLYPDVMEKGYSPETTVYTCVSLSDDAQVAPPLQVYEIPAGEYLQVEHWGDYAQLGVTWMAAFAYANLHGMTLGTGPAGEVYMTDPSTAPMEQWLTQIYIPLANDGSAKAANAPSA
jgi:effector-binding domain-containing protein